MKIVIDENNTNEYRHSQCYHIKYLPAMLEEFGFEKYKSGMGKYENGYVTHYRFTDIALKLTWAYIKATREGIASPDLIRWGWKGVELVEKVETKEIYRITTMAAFDDPRRLELDVEEFNNFIFA